MRLQECRFHRNFAPRTQTYFFMAEQKKLSIIAFSGDFDKLTAVFTLGTGAAAVGYEVNIFFTFWGLDAIKQKQGRSFTGAQEQRGNPRRTGRRGQGTRHQPLRL